MGNQLTYQDLDLLVEPGSPGRYRARVLRSPAGESGPVEFSLPFSAEQLEIFVLKVGRPRRGGTRGPGRPESAPLKAFGGQLHSAVFQDELHETLRTSISQASAEGMGLRLRLRLRDTPELAGLPWEFLYDPRRNHFLALSHRTPLVRYLDLPDPPRPLSVEGPLRLLVMISSPSDYDTLDVEQEWRTLTDALAPLLEAGRVVVERLEAASLAALQPRLRREEFHVFHFIGHGGYRPDWGDGVLVMEDRVGRGREVAGEELGGLLNDHDPMRLAVLNACEGARSDATDPFAGVAQSLIQQGLPAVVAMQFEITDAAAIVFAQELYGAIADSYPLDAAVAEARRAIRNDDNPTEWGTPVLYSRAPDGRLFDVTASPITIPATQVATAASPILHDPDQQDEQVSTTVSISRLAVPPMSRTEAATTGPRRESPPLPAHTPRELFSRQVRTFQHPSRRGISMMKKLLHGVAFSPDSQRLATASEDRTSRIWEVQTGQVLGVIAPGNQVWAVAFSPDGRWLATATEDYMARIWDTHSSLDEAHRMSHDSYVRTVAFSTNGRWLATGSNDSTARIWDAHTGQQLLELVHKRPVKAVAFSPDDRWLATGCEDNVARIWDAHTGQQLLQLPHDKWVKAVAFSPDGRWLATALDTVGGGRVWDAHSGHELFKIPTGSDSVAFSPDGHWLGIVGQGKSADIWDVDAHERAASLTHDDGVLSLAFSRDGRWLATGVWGNRAVLWALEAPP